MELTANPNENNEIQWKSMKIHACQCKAIKINESKGINETKRTSVKSMRSVKIKAKP